MTSAVTRAARTPVRADVWPETDVVASSGGASVITLQFQLTLPLDVAEQEVQAAINAATNLLPSDLPNPPVYSKVNPADPPIMTLAVTSTAMPMTQVEDMVETRVAQKISADFRRRAGHTFRRAASGGTRKT